MRKIVLTFGLISGAILIIMTAIMMPLCMSGAIDFDKSLVYGYTIMVLAFILVFFGIRTYRENHGGVIGFGRAVGVGLLITLVACAVYVVSWEIVYYNFLPDFDEKYSEHVINAKRAEGASAAEIAKTEQEMARFRELYANPFINVGMTFIEPLPVGLIVTLVSAAILRRRQTPGAPAAVTATA